MIDLSQSPLENCGWVHDQTLARSAQPTEEGFRWLQDQGFRGIIDLRREPHLTTPEWFYGPNPTDPKVDPPGRSSVVLATRDHYPVSDADVTRAKLFLKDPRHFPCLIFCGAGAGRTGHLVAMIRLLDDHWPLDLLEVKREALSYRVPAWWFRLQFALTGGRRGWLDARQVAAVAAYQETG